MIQYTIYTTFVDNIINMRGANKVSFPSAAEEELVDTISLDEFLIQNREASFLLRVKGDSMIDAGILEGDLVLVERGRSPAPGSIVIALVESEYTMHYFRKRDGRPYLESSGNKITPFTSEIRVEAVVTAVIRKY